MLLSKELQDKVVDLLVEDGLVDANLVRRAYLEVQKSGQPILAVLKSKKIATDDCVQHATAIVTKTPYVDLRNIRFDREKLAVIPQEVAQRQRAIPLEERDGVLIVAVLDVTNIQRTDYLSTLTGKPIRSVMTSDAGIENALMQYVADMRDMDKVAAQEEASAAEKANAQTITQDSPISKALPAILDYAAKSKASDIHIEPLEKSLVIRCRIDGVLRKTMELPKSVEAALISRIKIMAKLKIDEHRVPQDGQFAVNVNGNIIDLRIAIAPVVWGEQVVIRLLDKTGTSMDIEKMGMTGRALKDVVDGMSRPNGMILTSGPTGSGKSTTLYSILNALNTTERKIITLEDPIEYGLTGISQIPIQTGEGGSFAEGLRSVLRLDPDVVMVGEIRDQDTARTAIQASITGHLVLSSFHANSTCAAFSRMIDMIGVNPVFSSSVRLLIAQRLVRKLDDNKEAYQADASTTAYIKEALSNVELTDYDLNNITLYREKPSESNPFGFNGRTAIMEQLEVTEPIQRFIRGDVRGVGTQEIEKAARAEGMLTLEQKGILAALRGETTIDEVSRVI